MNNTNKKSIFDISNTTIAVVSTDFELESNEKLQPTKDIRFHTPHGALKWDTSKCVNKRGKHIGIYLEGEYAILTKDGDTLVIEHLDFDKEMKSLEKVYVLGKTINGLAILHDGSLVQIWKYCNLDENLKFTGYDEGSRTHNCIRGLKFGRNLVYTEWYADYSPNCPRLGTTNIKYWLKQEEEEFSKNKETSLFSK